MLVLLVSVVFNSGCISAPPKTQPPVTITGDVPFIGDYPLKIRLIEYAQAYGSERWSETYEWNIFRNRSMTEFVRSGEFTAYHSNFASTPVIPLYYQAGEGGAVNVKMPPLETINQFGYLTGIIQRTIDPKVPVVVYLIKPLPLKKSEPNKTEE
jgi:hypothetical protein